MDTDAHGFLEDNLSHPFFSSSSSILIQEGDEEKGWSCEQLEQLCFDAREKKLMLVAWQNFGTASHTSANFGSKV